jgi:hypothetical protein
MPQSSSEIDIKTGRHCVTVVSSNMLRGDLDTSRQRVFSFVSGSTYSESVQSSNGRFGWCASTKSQNIALNEAKNFAFSAALS